MKCVWFLHVDRNAFALIAGKFRSLARFQLAASSSIFNFDFIYNSSLTWLQIRIVCCFVAASNDFATDTLHTPRRKLLKYSYNCHVSELWTELREWKAKPNPKWKTLTPLLPYQANGDNILTISITLMVPNTLAHHLITPICIDLRCKGHSLSLPG